MSDEEERPCATCGGPCKVPTWALDSSYFANDVFGFAAHLAHCHGWVTREREEEVARIVAQTRALPAVATFPCVVCLKFSFNRDGVTCYWCGKRQAPEPFVDPTLGRPWTPAESATVFEKRPLAPAKEKAIVDAPPSLF